MEGNCVFGGGGILKFPVPSELNLGAGTLWARMGLSSGSILANFGGGPSAERWRLGPGVCRAKPGECIVISAGESGIDCWLIPKEGAEFEEWLKGIWVLLIAAEVLIPLVVMLKAWEELKPEVEAPEEDKEAVDGGDISRAAPLAATRGIRSRDRILLKTSTSNRAAISACTLESTSAFIRGSSSVEMRLATS